jgi:hypothetical protein
MSENPPGKTSKFNATWLAVGIGVGTAIGVALKNVPVGIGAGTAIGIALALTVPGKK